MCEGHLVPHLQWHRSTSYLTAIVMFALTFRVYEIFFDLEIDSQGEDRDLRHSLGSDRFFHNLSHMGTYLYVKCTQTNTHTHTVRDWGDDYKQNLQTRFAKKIRHRLPFAAASTSTARCSSSCFSGGQPASSARVDFTSSLML